jgi:DNA-binding transcriptional ArsR family regulator
VPLTAEEIARRAGVQRLRVYNHFPEDIPLFGACQVHRMALHPLHDLSAALALPDPGARLRAVLRSLYGWNRETAPMTRARPGRGRGGSPGARWKTFLYRYILPRMARAATTADAFNAVAEPRRREILDALADGERPVNDLVRLLGLPQPQVSKHLRVLREVGAVDVRDQGRRRLYRLNGYALKPIHDWVKTYERSWSERFEQLDAVLDDLKQMEGGEGGDDE